MVFIEFFSKMTLCYLQINDPLQDQSTSFKFVLFYTTTSMRKCSDHFKVHQFVSVARQSSEHSAVA